jgi:hypothetical protein
MYRLTSRIGGLRLYTFYSGKKSNPSFTECPPMTIQVIQHEGTHAIIRRVFGTVAIPVALNEGFATYFEAVNLRLRFQAIGNDKAAQNAKLERRANSKRIAYLRRTIDKFELNPPGIRYLLGLDQKTTWAPDGLGAKCAAHYSLSESFIDFLTDTACGRYALMALRKRLARKQTPLFSDTTLNTLEPEWHKFLAQKWKIPIRRKSAGKKRANARR